MRREETSASACKTSCQSNKFTSVLCCRTHQKWLVRVTHRLFAPVDELRKVDVVPGKVTPENFLGTLTLPPAPVKPAEADLLNAGRRARCEQGEREGQADAHAEPEKEAVTQLPGRVRQLG